MILYMLRDYNDTYFEVGSRSKESIFNYILKTHPNSILKGYEGQEITRELESSFINVYKDYEAGKGTRVTAYFLEEVEEV